MLWLCFRIKCFDLADLMFQILGSPCPGHVLETDLMFQKQFLAQHALVMFQQQVSWLGRPYVSKTNTCTGTGPCLSWLCFRNEHLDLPDLMFKKNGFVCLDHVLGIDTWVAYLDVVSKTVSLFCMPRLCFENKTQMCIICNGLSKIKYLYLKKIKLLIENRLLADSGYKLEG